MKLNEILEVMNDNQFVDVYYKGNNGQLVKCASRNNEDAIEDSVVRESEVLNISVTKYNTFDVLIERVIRKFRVHFEVPRYQIETTFDEDFVFEDGEDEDDIEDAIREAFDEWLDNLKDDIDSYAEKEVEEVED